MVKRGVESWSRISNPYLFPSGSSNCCVFGDIPVIVWKCPAPFRRRNACSYASPPLGVELSAGRCHRGQSRHPPPTLLPHLLVASPKLRCSIIIIAQCHCPDFNHFPLPLQSTNPDPNHHIFLARALPSPQPSFPPPVAIGHNGATDSRYPIRDHAAQA